MITSLILYSLVLGALLSAGAMLIDWAARRAAMPRRWGWLGALAMLLALPALAPWRVAQTNAAASPLDMSNAVVVNEIGSAAASPGLWDRAVSGVTSLLSLPVEELLTAVGARVPASLDAAIGWAWAVAALVCLVTTLWALNRLDRQRRDWPRATVLGLPVRVAANHGPAVYGVIEPDIVLPSALLSRSGDEQQLVLAHEDEHRQAYDPALLALSAVAVSLMPWNPFAWWCASRLRLAVELDCDARVLARGATPRRYGEMLLTLASAISNRRGLVPALSLLDSRRHLERRILAMTARPARRTPLHVAAVLAAGAAVVMAACSTDLPTAAEIEEADVSAVTQTLGVAEGTSVAYFVDGKEVTAEQAKTLAGDAISSIEVVKGNKVAPSAGQVHIITKANAQWIADTIVVADGEGPVVEGRENVFVLKTEADGKNGETVEFKVNGTKTAGGILRLKATDEKGTINIRGDSLHVTSSFDASAQPLMVVDGVIVKGGKAELGKLGVSPDKIASIEVIKGDAALRQYGDRGKAGVIKITTKERR